VLLFTGLATLFFHFGRKNEASLYRGTRLVTLSQLMHRYRGNVGALSVIAVTTSVALCAVLCCCSIFGKTEESTRVVHPFSVEYMSSPERQEAFDETLKEHPEVLVRSRTDIRLLYAAVAGRSNKDDYAVYIIGQSNYNDALAAQGRSDQVSLPGGLDCLYVQFMQNYSNKSDLSGLVGKSLDVSAGSETLRLNIAQISPKTYISLDSYMRTVVVPDAVYAEMRDHSGVPEYGLTAYMFRNDLVAGPFVAALEARMQPLDDRDRAQYKAIGRVGGTKARFSGMDAYYPNYAEGLKAMGVLVFVGVFIGLLFIVATGGILYFRMAMEASEDREKFIVLRKIGMSAGEIRRAVAKELAVVFGVPFAMAALNAFFASYPLEGIVGLGMKDVLAVVLAVYAAFYGLYYLLTLNKYVKTLGTDA
jgi:putative ABC transport system permease protein